MLEAAALILAGFLIGAYATGIGAGGGFLFAPFLLWRYAEASPVEVTTASLSVVVLSSGFSALLARRSVDRPLAGVLAAAAIPAALLGAAGTALLPRGGFAVLFAVILFLAGGYLALRPLPRLVDPVRRGWSRSLTAGADIYTYRVPVGRSLAVTAAASSLASLAGIGGGLIYTPLVTRVMRVPFAVAVPVAQSVVTALAAAVVAFHLALGHAGEPMRDVPALGAGVLLAGPAGRLVQRRLGQGLLTRVLAGGLLLVAARTLFF